MYKVLISDNIFIYLSRNIIYCFHKTLIIRQLTQQVNFLEPILSVHKTKENFTFNH